MYACLPARQDGDTSKTGRGVGKVWENRKGRTIFLYPPHQQQQAAAAGNTSRHHQQAPPPGTTTNITPVLCIHAHCSACLARAISACSSLPASMLCERVPVYDGEEWRVPTIHRSTPPRLFIGLSLPAQYLPSSFSI